MVKRSTAAGCTAWVAMSVHCQLLYNDTEFKLVDNVHSNCSNAT